MNGTRALAGVAALVTASVLLTGCSPGTAAETSPREPLAPMFEHIHELVVDPSDGTLLVATHEGLYRLAIEADGTATAVGPIGGLDFDPMGFTVADGIAYASGHPGPTTPDTFGSPNLGLITSTDMGESWTNVSLTGEIDFHALTVTTAGDAPGRVYGYDGSAQRLERSFDGGSTWVNGARLAARDILAVGDRLYATTAEGLVVSTDDGATFTLDPSAPALFVIAADSDATLAGTDTSGTLWTQAAGQEWVSGGTTTGTPQAFAVDGRRIYVADDRGIAVTENAGATWTILEAQVT
ncbi:F510_1955 family glycosylhydrolase [Pseudolysinimonas sp.]